MLRLGKNRPKRKLLFKPLLVLGFVLAEMLILSFSPAFTPSVSADSTGATDFNLPKRWASGGVAAQSYLGANSAVYATCTAYFDNTPRKDLALLNAQFYPKTEELPYDQDVARLTELYTSVFQNTIDTWIGRFYPNGSGSNEPQNRDEIVFIMKQRDQISIPVIRFKKSGNSPAPVNGANYKPDTNDVCEDPNYMMIPVATNRWRGFQVLQKHGDRPDSKPPDASGMFMEFTLTSSTPTGTTPEMSEGNFNYWTKKNDSSTIVQGSALIKVAGIPRFSGGNQVVGQVPGNWINASTIEVGASLQTPAYVGEKYKKYSWSTRFSGGTAISYYFLDSSPKAERVTWSETSQKCDNPLSTPSPCDGGQNLRNCVPFIEVRQRLDVDHADFGLNRLKGDINALPTAQARMYDYDEQCLTKPAPRVVLSGNANANGLVWLFYSSSRDSFLPVWSTGGQNEIIYIAEYKKKNPGEYEGGIRGCEARIFASNPGPVTTPGSGGGPPTVSNTFTARWALRDASCTGVQYGEITVAALGGAPGEEAYNTALGQIQDPTAPGVGDDEEKPDCQNSGNPLSWILCEIYDGLTFVSDFIVQHMLRPFIEPRPIGLDPNDPVSGSTYEIWSAFRIYGNIVLVILLLVAVISQAVGGGIVEAYTARKMLPRILVGAILINTSIYIVAFGVDIARVVGNGIADLITAPLNSTGNFTFRISDAAGNTIGGVLIAIVVAAKAAGVLGLYLPFILLFLILPAALAMLGAFITIILLQALIIALAITAPVAFALYCLPNTEKYFHTWWDWFYRALLIFPIFMAIVGISDLMTALIQQANSGNGITNIFGVIVGFFVQFIPLLIIPFTFKLAGGLLGRINEFLGGYGSKLGEFIKGNPNDPFSLRNRVKRRSVENMTRRQFNILQRGRETVDPATGQKVMPGRIAQFRSRFAGFVGRNIDERMARYNEEAEKRMNDLTGHGDDSPVYAGAGWTLRAGEAITPEMAKFMSTGFAGRNTNAGSVSDYDRYFDSKGREISQASYANGQAKYGSSVQSLGQAFNYTLRKAQKDKDIQAFEYSIGRNVQDRGWTQADMNTMYPAAAYPHKGKFMSQWYSKPEVQPNGAVQWNRVQDITAGGQSAYREMTSDMHRNLQQYMQSGEHDRVARVMAKWQKELENRVGGGVATQKDVDDLVRTYELFDNITAQMPNYGGQQNQQGQLLTPPPGGDFTAAGTTAATRPIVETARRDRAYQLAQTIDLATGRRQLLTNNGNSTGYYGTGGDAGYQNL